jgi:hypothetical protein
MLACYRYNPAMRTILASISALALGAAACGPGRTAAATQPTPAAFDPSKSDAKAVALADTVMTSLGGVAKWQAVKQLKFDFKYSSDGAVKAMRSHAWDRWDGRHHYTTFDLAKAPGGDPSKADQIEVYYDLFDDSAKVHGSINGKDMQTDDANRLRGEAKSQLAEDSYILTVLFRLRDPGVMLTMDTDLPEDPTHGLCKGGCTHLKVSFDPTVGKDTWWIDINKGSNEPEMLEQQTAGQAGITYFHITNWTTVNGLKFPTTLSSVGSSNETFEYSNIEIGDPDDRLYMPTVGGD